MISIYRLMAASAFVVLTSACTTMQVKYLGVVEEAKTENGPVRVVDGTAVDGGLKLTAELGKAISLKVENNTPSKLKVIWDECLIVDQAGVSHRTVHTGVRYAGKNEHQPPSVVLAGHTLEDEISNSDNIWFERNNWVDEGALKGSWPMSESKAREVLNSEYLGKHITLIVPIQIDGKQKDYELKMKILGYAKRHPTARNAYEPYVYAKGYEPNNTTL